MSKETLELKIKVLIDEARKNTQDISADIKRLCDEAKQGEADTKQLAVAMQKMNGEAMKRTAAEAKLFGQSLGNLKQQQALVKNAMIDMVSSGIVPEAEAVQKLRSEYDKLGKEIADVEKQNPQVIDSFADLKKAITGTAGALALLKAASVVKGLGDFALDTADTFKTAREEFGILLNDMQAGAGLFDQIKKFNDLTPFDLDTTKQATKLLLTAKVPLSDINTMLTRMGDLSQGNAQRMVSFASAYSKAAAKGKADMEVLNVYIDQGVPILDALAQKFNVTSAEIVNMVSTGKVSFSDFNRALADLTAQGGRYFGGMELASKSYKAMQEGLKESVNSLAASFGSMLLPAAIKVVEVLTALTNAVNNSPLLKGAVVAALIAAGGYITFMTAKMVFLIAKTKLATLAQMGYNLAIGALNPAVMATTIAVGAAIGTLTFFASKNQDAEKSANEAALAAKKQANAMNELKAAAEAYVSFMDELDSRQAQRIVHSISSIVIPAAQKELDDAMARLSTIPQKIQIKERKAGGARRIGSTITRTVTNPDYLKAQEAVEAAQKALHKYQAELDAAKVKVQEITKAEAERRAAFGRDWQDKNLGGLDKILREKEKSIAELAKKAQEAFGENWKTEAAYKKELGALESYYQKQIDEYNKKPLFSSSWVQKNADNIGRLKAELDKARGDLDTAAKKSFGENFKINEAYIKEKAALEMYYQKQIADAERKNILDAHNKRMAAAKEETEFRRAQALNKIDGGEKTAQNYADFAQAEVLSQIQHTDVGQLAMGADPITMFISAVIRATVELENVNKLLNFMGTIVDAMFEVIGPIIDGAAKDLVVFLEEVGRIAGQLLAPVLSSLAVPVKLFAAYLRITLTPLQLVGRAFEWLNNKVIVPFGNFVIDLVNSIIDLINIIPGVDIKKLEPLRLIGKEAEAIAAEMEKHRNAITRMYERQKDRVRDELNAQIGSIKKQYELGLISREDYNKQTEAYGKAADDKLYDINKEMADTLKRIDINTYNALSAERQQQVRHSYAKEWGDKVPVLGHLAGAVVDIGKKIGDGIKSGWNKVGKFFGWWDVGSWDIPQAQLGVVHPGEIVIPKPFSEGIRQGKLSLSGSAAKKEGVPLYRTNRTRQEQNISVYVTVQGSVKTEKDLVRSIYDGIAGAIGAGELTPLPQGA